MKFINLSYKINKNTSYHLKKVRINYISTKIILNMNKLTHRSKSEEFNLLDSAVINLIVEKTKLNKEKYSLILSKTVIIYMLIIVLAMFSTVYKFVSKEVIVVALTVGTLLLFVVYLYVIEHFNKMDRDIDEVVSLLQTKAFMKNK